MLRGYIKLCRVVRTYTGVQTWMLVEVVLDYSVFQIDIELLFLRHVDDICRGGALVQMTAYQTRAVA